MHFFVHNPFVYVINIYFSYNILKSFVFIHKIELFEHIFHAIPSVLVCRDLLKTRLHSLATSVG